MQTGSMDYETKSNSLLSEKNFHHCKDTQTKSERVENDILSKQDLKASSSSYTPM
jgi:hypothetical protein